MIAPSPTAVALAELQRWHPGWDLVSIDWQIVQAHSIDPEDTWQGPQHSSPWVLITVGQPSETWEQVPAWLSISYAIWKRTGAIHDIDPTGAVSDDPVWSPASLGSAS